MGNFILTSTVIAAVITVGSMTLPIKTVFTTASSAVYAANVQQITTALGLYFFDHGTYPRVSGGAALIAELAEKGYIQTGPFDASSLDYQVLKNGEKYALSLKK